MVEEHLPSKLKPDGDSFVCVYEDCKSNINAVKQFRTHVARNHLNVEPVVLQSVVKPNLVETVEMGEGFDEENNDHNNEEEEVNVHFKVSDVAAGLEDMDIYPDNVVKDEIGRFYLKLEADLVLPTTSVQTIAEEIKLLSELSHYKLRRTMRAELLPHLKEADVNNIVRKTLRSDPVFNTHHKGEDPAQFGTNHLRVQYWKKRFRFVEPEKKFLGQTASGKKMYAHYVPVREALQIMLKDEKVKQEVIKSFDRETRDPDVLEDFTDGSFYKNHKFQTPGHAKCIQLLLFQDAFDHNAFGSSSGQYKPNGFYYTLGNLPDHLRSKLDLIQAAYMVLDKDLKPTQGEELNDVDRLKLSLQPLIDALIDLQQNGIDFNGEKLPVCVIFLLGDSLGQNFIGGYVRNFSTCEFSCRFCPTSKTQFLDKPYETKPFRTREEYDEYAEKAKAKWLQVRRDSLKAQKRAREGARKRAQRAAARCTAPGKKRNLSLPVSKTAYKRMLAVNYRGVKYRPSPFNRPELGFHVVGAQPPCLAHDLHEGIIKRVVPAVLKHMIDEKNWFDLETLNKRIADFKCKGYDALDRVKPLKSLEKLAGNAVENLNFLILLPFILGSLVRDPDDPYWKTYLLLKEITEYVCAPRIHMQQVAYLRRLIDAFLSKMKLLMPSLLTAKVHYLCHYPDLIALYGPLSKLFTLRFESKHKFFKKVLKTCQNFINVTFTMTRKYACRFALDNSTESLLPNDIVYPEISPLQLSAVEEKALKDSKVDVSKLAEVKWVTFKGTDYKKDKWMVLGSESVSVLKLGQIKKILMDKCSEDIMFVMDERLAKNNYQGVYVIQPQDLGQKNPGSQGLARLLPSGGLWS